MVLDKLFRQGLRDLRRRALRLEELGILEASTVVDDGKTEVHLDGLGERANNLGGVMRRSDEIEEGD